MRATASNAGLSRTLGLIPLLEQLAFLALCSIGSGRLIALAGQRGKAFPACSPLRPSLSLPVLLPAAGDGCPGNRCDYLCQVPPTHPYPHTGEMALCPIA